MEPKRLLRDAWDRITREDLRKEYRWLGVKDPDALVALGDQYPLQPNMRVAIRLLLQMGVTEARVPDMIKVVHRILEQVGTRSEDATEAAAQYVATADLYFGPLDEMQLYHLAHVAMTAVRIGWSA